MRKSNQAPVAIVAILLLVTAMTLSAIPDSATKAVPVDRLKNQFHAATDNLPVVSQDQQVEGVESSSAVRRIPYIPNIVSENANLPFIPNIIGPNAVLPYIPNMVPGAVMSEAVVPPVDIADYEHKLNGLLPPTTTFYVDNTAIPLDYAVQKP